MSKFLQPPLYTGRGLENQLKNTIWNAHDLICGCPKPKQHLEYLISGEKCLSTTEDNKITTDADPKDGEEINLDIGDLDALFADTDEQLG